MRRFLLLGLVPLTIAAGGGGSAPAGPEGILYRCGEQGARITFNGQGYVPGLTVATTVNGQVGRTARATATLYWNGRRFAMRSDWDYIGLRYRSFEPYDEGHSLVFAMDGERGSIGLVPIGGSQEQRQEMMSCTRARTVADARAAAAGLGAPGGGSTERASRR